MQLVVSPRMLKDVAEVDDLSLLHVELPLRYQATVTGKTIMALKRDEGDGALEETAVCGGDEVGGDDGAVEGAVGGDV